MKLAIAAFLVVSTFVPVLAVDCYVKAFDEDHFEVLNGGLENFREYRRQSFWQLKIEKGCNHCYYKLDMYAEYDFGFVLEHAHKMWEDFACGQEQLKDDGLKHECHAPEFYKNVTEPVDTKNDVIKCNTDLCNKPCYPDPVLPLPSDPPPKRDMVDCYVHATSYRFFDVKTGGIEPFREGRRNGTFKLKIEKNCRFCTYKLRFHEVVSSIRWGNNLHLHYAMSESFECSHKALSEYKQECHDPTFYKPLTGPVEEKDDVITCRTNLCNKPCYPDPVLPLPPTDPPSTAPPPTISAKPTVSYDDINELNTQSNPMPSPKRKKRRKRKKRNKKRPTNDVSAHKINTILVLAFITAFIVLLS